MSSLRQRPKFLETNTFHTAMKQLSRAHVGLYRRTRGKLGATMPVSARLWLPVCLLTHAGRKSGIPRVTPLLFMPDAERVVLFAAQGGLPQNPQWYLNLKADPDCTIQVGSQVRRLKARTASAAEREALWPRMKQHYPGWGAYQSWCEREIPVVICEP